MTLKIAAQLYTIQKACGENLPKALSRLSEIGFQNVELAGFYDRTVKEINQLTSERNLTIISSMVSFNDLATKTPSILDDHEVFGCRYLTIPNIPSELRSEKAGWLKAAQVIHRFSEEAAKRNFQVLYHNHAYEFETRFDGDFAFNIFRNQCPVIHWEFDVYWLAKACVDPSPFLLSFGNKVPLLHVKDVNREDKSFAEVGRGTLDWDQILATARVIGTSHLVIEQDICKTDPFDCLQGSLNFLSKKINSSPCPSL